MLVLGSSVVVGLSVLATFPAPYMSEPHEDNERERPNTAKMILICMTLRFSVNEIRRVSSLNSYCSKV